MIGEDPVTGTDQSMGTLWQRIQAHWVRQLGDKITEERSHSALMNHFSNFQRDVNKFLGYYKNVHDNPISGYNEYDMMHCNVNKNLTRRLMKRGVDLDINEPRNWSESTPTTPSSSTPTISTPGSINLGDDDTPVDTEGSNMSRPKGQKTRKIRKKKTPSLEASILKQLEAITAQGVMFGEAGVEGERMRLQLSMEKQRTKQLAIESNLEKERTKQLEIKTRERMAKMEFERDIMR
ncbi:uncharacterized protein LOC132270522 [Cornus florida]|uniref:uncharacterized protein LOC132270522 n=1 Tax=Cornus florida TaxID=4283 RepID=UPI0028975D79|nr:uncharacterized protein LOC132270522 [Cornus florida]